MLAFVLPLAVVLLPIRPATFVQGAQTTTKPASVEPPTYEGAPRTTVRVVYEGRFELEAHYAKPHDTRPFGTRLTVLTDGADRARLDWETWPVGREEKRDVETTLVDATRVWFRPEATKPFVEKLGLPAALLRMRLEAAAPWLALARLRASPQPLSTSPDGSCAWKDPVLGARSLAWNAAERRIAGFARDYAHPRLGDVRDDVVYASWETRDGIAIPAAFTLKEMEGENALHASPGTFAVRLAKVEQDFDVGHDLDAPESAQRDTPPTPDEPIAIEVDELEPGLTSFLAKKQQARSYVVEFADHVVAIDAPVSSAVGESIVDAIRKRFPAKPIRYVLFGHFHPHYTGGLRAFLAAGARVVAPDGCARFAAEIAQRSFTLQPDRWARAGRNAEIETFEGSRVFEDASRRLEAVDIGKSSKHTEEFVVFHLARTHTLLQDDIGWYAGKDGNLSFAPGSRGLYEAVLARKLEVVTVRQSWPVDHPRPSISWTEFELGAKSAN